MPEISVSARSLGCRLPTCVFRRSTAGAPARSPNSPSRYCWSARSMSAPPMPTVQPVSIPRVVTTAISVLPPPMSTIMTGSLADTGTPSPSSAHTGASTTAARLAPLLYAASESICRSEGVLPQGTGSSILNFFLKNTRSGTTFSASAPSSRAVPLTSSATPLDMGMETVVPPAALPINFFASAPHAASFSRRPPDTASTDGSLSTSPVPRWNIDVFELPASTASSTIATCPPS